MTTSSLLPLKASVVIRSALGLYPESESRIFFNLVRSTGTLSAGVLGYYCLGAGLVTGDQIIGSSGEQYRSTVIDLVHNIGQTGILSAYEQYYGTKLVNDWRAGIRSTSIVDRLYAIGL